MNYQILYDEITNDPLGRGYSGMTDEDIATDLNTAYRTETRDTLSSAEIYENLDVVEFQEKSDAQKVYVRDILGLGDEVQVGPGTKARTVLISVFGPGSDTITALAAMLEVPISRAQEIGLWRVKVGHVQLVTGV
jgi:hypothetical protein